MTQKPLNEDYRKGVEDALQILINHRESFNRLSKDLASLGIYRTDCDKSRDCLDNVIFKIRFLLD